MAKKFTEKQREMLARRLGYQGPMEMFDQFVKSDPAIERKYSIVMQKLMARGGMVKKFQAGGAVFSPEQIRSYIDTNLAGASDVEIRAAMDQFGVNSAQVAQAYGMDVAEVQQRYEAAGKVKEEKPTQPVVPTVTAAQITPTENQFVQTQGAPTGVTAVTPISTGRATTAAVPRAKPAVTMTADQAADAIYAELAKLRAAQGVVSPQAQVTAAQMEPTTTAVSQLQAAQGVAGQVQGAPTRTLQSGEVIEGPAVDRQAVEAALARNEAAQGVVTEDMTIQGQLAKLTADFESSNPPAWAASAIRNATEVLAQRGLAASSLAGQAVIQATLEAALPIAAADAAAYREMGLANLNNRQQMAVITAQQRTAFLGQEFDQAFQTRVLNAATISEIANINFSAKQQIALENARLTETMNLANLSNRQAMVMATAAQIATLETTNLNNRQQAAVFNAQAFLQMDMANLANEQQTALFKAQAMTQALLSDTAATNAARQFNASSENQVNQFYDGLTSQVNQFNAAQMNAMAQFNTEQFNSIAQFNAASQNQRDQFNADFRRIIDQSNAEWRRNIALANTAAINRANEFNATAALGITTIEYNNLWQTYRDQIEYAWKTAENVLDRENELARQILVKQGQVEAAKLAAKAEMNKALGALATTVFDKAGGTDAIAKILKGITGGTVKAGTDLLNSIFKTDQYVEIENPAKPGDAAYNWNFYGDGTNNVSISPDGKYYFNDELVYDQSIFDLGGTLGEDGYTYY